MHCAAIFHCYFSKIPAPHSHLQNPKPCQNRWEDLGMRWQGPFDAGWASPTGKHKNTTFLRKDWPLWVASMDKWVLPWQMSAGSRQQVAYGCIWKVPQNVFCLRGVPQTFSICLLQPLDQTHCFSRFTQPTTVLASMTKTPHAHEHNPKRPSGSQ